jgi:hypothetical protein
LRLITTIVRAAPALVAKAATKAPPASMDAGLSLGPRSKGLRERHAVAPRSPCNPRRGHNDKQEGQMTDDRSNADQNSGATPSGAASMGWAGQGTAGQGFGGSNPADQVTQSLKAVSEALKSASEKVASSSQEVGMCAIRQAEQNSQQLFDALRAMASTTSPREVTELYTRFVSESAKNHAAQLREMGELFARTSREAWAPVTDALARAQTPK